jgi:hypothetical protein
MLFDLRGRRRRAVQGTYLMLAVLMGGGLVLFGVGSNVSGGLLNAFNGGGGSSGDSALQKTIDKQEERLAKQPRNEVLLQSLVRNYYAEATSQRQSGASFPPDAKKDLRKAGSYWTRYVAVADKPNPATAGYALQVYDVGALNKPKEAAKAASILAQQANDTPSYLRLVSYASRAGDTRTADLAAQKAIDLAPKSQRKLVKQQVEALKKAGPQQQPSG